MQDSTGASSHSRDRRSGTHGSIRDVGLSRASLRKMASPSSQRALASARSSACSARSSACSATSPSLSRLMRRSRCALADVGLSRASLRAMVSPPSTSLRRGTRQPDRSDHDRRRPRTGRPPAVRSGIQPGPSPRESCKRRRTGSERLTRVNGPALTQ